MAAPVRRRKERSVKELYNATDIIKEPEITPVLRGIYQMQGPVDEIDQDIEKDMVPSHAVKSFDKRSMSQKVHIKAESGTCNVCFAPCSSCMHLNMVQMGSKSDEYSDETCRVASQFSINEGKACDSMHHAPSEASNLLSVNSSHDSFSENGESKATTRPSDVSDASEVVGTQKTSSKKHEDSKGVEGHDDNISCVSRDSDGNIAVCNKDLDSKNLSLSSASLCSLGPEASGKVPTSQKLSLSELSCKKEIDAGSDSPKIQSSSFRSQSGKCPIGSNSEVSTKTRSKLEVETDTDSRGVPDKAVKCSDDDVEQAKSNELLDLPDTQECPLQAASYESDESDVVEHDVKVCDICGDAGREDLLAICSKCTDGAEHTYCMREMLQKVPEGDWLCEECKLAEEAESQKQGSDAEVKRTNKLSSSTKSSGKRPAETLESASAPKRQAIELNTGSPKLSSPSRIPALSRESSFKSLDKGKVKSSQITSGNHSHIDVSETARSPTSGPRMQTPKGTLLKSNSFSNFSSKPKVKLVDEVVPQKQKVAREQVSLDTKEEPSRSLAKSMSFKNANPGRSNAGESKVKMLSSKYSQVQDVKGLKQVKDRGSFERKNLPKLDRSSSTILKSKVDQKLAPRAESNFHSSASNNRESKLVQPDGKLCMLSRSTSNVARKGVESVVTSAVGASLNSGVRGSAEQNSIQISVKDEPSSSSSRTAERQSSNFNGVMQEGSSRSTDSMNPGEKTRESSANRSSKGLPCQKCKEHGHATENCTICIPETSGVDVSAPRNSMVDISKGNKLKAAIEAAIRLKPGICERTSQDQLSIASKTKNNLTVEGMPEGRSQTTNSNGKQLTAHSTDAVSILPSVGNPAMKDWSSYNLATVSGIFKMSAIPEHEYKWQGGFEVHRDGRVPEYFGGVQAHLSTLASPRVFDVVNRFPHKVDLDEVPRMSTWPAQFEESGPREDNIALYFFAKDIESYENNYRGLLDNMVKNDLALKGNFDGVELLIFPSNLLPENCQRWNTLFFLWGVFKGRRVDCSNSSKNLCIPSSVVVPLDEDISADVPQNIYSPKPVDNEQAASSSICNTVPVINASEKKGIAITEVCDIKVSSLEQASVGSNAKSERQDSQVDSKCLLRTTSCIQLQPETKCNSTSLVDNRLREHGSDTTLRPSLQSAETNSGSITGEKFQMYIKEDTMSFKNPPAGNQEASVTMDIDGDQVKFRNSKVYDGCVERKTASKRDINSWQLNHEKRPYLDLTEAPPEISVETNEKMPWDEGEVKSVFVDGESASKKLKTDFSALYECNSSRDRNILSDSFGAEMHDLGSSSSVEDKRCDNDEKVIHEDLGTSERYFFPVDSRHAKDFPGNNHMSWRDLSTEDDDRFHDGVPNLELALGADRRPSNKGMLPFFFGLVDKNNERGKPLDKKPDKEEDDMSASLSLSLSFPSSDKEQTVKHVPKTEQLLPEKRSVNTSLFLYGGFPDK